MNFDRRVWRTWLPVGVTVVVLLVAYTPLLQKFFRSLWNRSHYQHYPFVLGAFAWLVWQRVSQSEPKQPTESKRLTVVSGLLLALAWLQLALAYYIHSPWLAAVSAIVLVGGFLVRVSRVRQLENAWGLWLILWLILPLPTHPDQQLIAALQLQSSQLSSVFLDWVNIPHLMAGNVLHLADKQLFVDEACSGIVSLMSIVACAVIYSVWNNRSLDSPNLLVGRGHRLGDLDERHKDLRDRVCFRSLGSGLDGGSGTRATGTRRFLANFLGAGEHRYPVAPLHFTD